MERTILIVEDDKHINDILVLTFQKEGYKVLSALDGIKGLDMALNENPDIILLDVMLPGLDGFEVLKKLREKSLHTPVIMLTARDDEVDTVLGLELGADDYITKPYSNRELTARVKANLRRSSYETPADTQKPEPSTILSGELSINTERYEVTKAGKVLDITFLKTFGAMNITVMYERLM